MHRREFLEKRKILEKCLAIVWNTFWIAESGGFFLEEFFWSNPLGGLTAMIAD